MKDTKNRWTGIVKHMYLHGWVLSLLLVCSTFTCKWCNTSCPKNKISQFQGASALMGLFKRNVWCARKNLFPESTSQDNDIVFTGICIQKVSVMRSVGKGQKVTQWVVFFLSIFWGKYSDFSLPNKYVSLLLLIFPNPSLECKVQLITFSCPN